MADNQHTPATPEIQGVPTTPLFTPADDLHDTVVSAVDAIRAILENIAFDSPANGAARALHFVADGLSNAAHQYDRAELEAIKASKADGANA